MNSTQVSFIYTLSVILNIKFLFLPRCFLFDGPTAVATATADCSKTPNATKENIQNKEFDANY